MKRLPAEFEKQRAAVLLFPSREDVWRKHCDPIRRMMVDLANVMARYQPVILGVLPELMDIARNNYSYDENVTLVEMKYNDCWSRDTVSSVVLGDEPHIAAFTFNAYGGELYTPWDDDDRLDYKIGELFGYPVKDCPVVLEGGNFLPDGHGTLFAVKDAIVNDNRNPDLSIEEIEKRIKDATGTEQIIWLPRGLAYDETGGHIDNVMAFADKETVILSWTDDKNDPQYEIVREAEKIIKSARSLEGKEYKIVHLPIPPIYYRTEDDCADIIEADDSFARLVGEPVLDTYVNYAIVNGAIIVPQFNNGELDKMAIDILKNVYRDMDVIPFYSREASLGGGGLHCLTKHIN